MGSLYTHLEPLEYVCQNVPIQALSQTPNYPRQCRVAFVLCSTWIIQLDDFWKGKTLLTHLLTHSTCISSEGMMGQTHVPVQQPLSLPPSLCYPN